MRGNDDDDGCPMLMEGSDAEDDDDESLFERREKWRDLWDDDVDDWQLALETPGPQKRQKATVRREGRYEAEAAAHERGRFRLDPSTSPWWELINHRDVWDETSRTGRRFRRKFRLPMKLVMKLVALAQKIDHWKDKPAGQGQGKGPSRHPLILKVLAALRCLGKGIDSETIEEAARISEKTLGVFIPQFIHWLATDIYAKEVCLPEGVIHPLLHTIHSSHYCTHTLASHLDLGP